MTETRLQRKGRDFAIGFFGSLILLVITAIPLFLKGPADAFFISILGLLLAIIVSFANQRAVIGIGIGIITALVAVPLLLLGSCLLAYW